MPFEADKGVIMNGWQATFCPHAANTFGPRATNLQFLPDILVKPSSVKKISSDVYANPRKCI